MLYHGLRTEACCHVLEKYGLRNPYSTPLQDEKRKPKATADCTRMPVLALLGHVPRRQLPMMNCHPRCCPPQPGVSTSKECQNWSLMQILCRICSSSRHVHPECSSVSHQHNCVYCFPLILCCLTGECDVGGRRGLLCVAGNFHHSHLLWLPGRKKGSLMM